MDKTQAKQLVGHRLIVDSDKIQTMREYTLLELSPSGTRVKFENRTGATFWCGVEEYSVVEDLGTAKAGE